LSTRGNLNENKSVESDVVLGMFSPIGVRKRSIMTSKGSFNNGNGA
jgi:hypothetical protein